jgi:hypothetical protein
MAHLWRTHGIHVCAPACTTPRQTIRTQLTWNVSIELRKSILYRVVRIVYFVVQVIDAGESWLQNVIEFPPEGAFIVNSSLDVAGDQRMQFKFQYAVFKVSGRKFTLPPFGKGWCAFETAC